jgi:hypothetical protein
MKKIPLTQGKFAIVDDEDFEFLNQWKWHAHKGGNTFYAERNIRKSDGKKTTIAMHQVLAKRLGFKHRADHIDGNGLNNQKSNLQDLTNKQKQNAEKQRLSKNNTSGHKGVCWFKRDSKWLARIRHNGKGTHLGLFDKLEDAIAARKDGERKYFTHA